MKILEQFSDPKKGVFVVDMGSWVAVGLPLTYDVQKIDSLLTTIAHETKKRAITFLNGALIYVDCTGQSESIQMP